MPRSVTIPLGPGRFENTTFKVWVSKRDGISRRYHARLEGTVPVYCGSGHRHDVAIREEQSAWAWPDGGEDGAPLIVEAFLGGIDEAYELASELERVALEDWADPCDAEADAYDDEADGILKPIDPNTIPKVARTAAVLANLIEAHLIEYSETSEGEGSEMSVGDFGLYLISVAEMGMETS